MIEIYVDKGGEWRWRKRASNGKITLEGGEGYASKWNVKRAIRSHGLSLALGGIKVVRPYAINGDY